MTDPVRTPDPERIIAALPAGWGVIYRCFGAKDRDGIASRLARVCRARRLVFLVSADPGLAMRVRADGVHWPEQRAIPRSTRPRWWIETMAAHSQAAIARAHRLGLDAAIVSTVFSSSSSSAKAPIGPVRFHALARQSALPLYALGGINAVTAPRITTHPRIAGIAAIDGLKILERS